MHPGEFLTRTAPLLGELSSRSGPRYCTDDALVERPRRLVPEEADSGVEATSSPDSKTASQPAGAGRGLTSRRREPFVPE
ncbi:unnamed protein product, partial [Symbiodinium sp. CCMP2456]